jgi:hypothetical protein
VFFCSFCILPVERNVTQVLIHQQVSTFGIGDACRKVVDAMVGNGAYPGKMELDKYNAINKSSVWRSFENEF